MNSSLLGLLYFSIFFIMLFFFPVEVGHLESAFKISATEPQHKLKPNLFRWKKPFRIWIIKGIHAKNLEATLLCCEFLQDFESIHWIKMEEILLEYGFLKETVTGIMRLYKDVKAKVPLHYSHTDLFLHDHWSLAIAGTFIHGVIYIYIYIYIYTYNFFFFIIQHVKASAILRPHQPATRVITVSVAQGEVLPLLVAFCYWTGYLKEIYVYIYTRSAKSRHYIGRSFIFSLVQLCDLKNAFTYGRWCHSNRFLILRNHTRRWFRMHIIHVEILSISVIYLVRFPSVFSFFMHYYNKSTRDKCQYIILLKDVIYSFKKHVHSSKEWFKILKMI